MTIKLQLDDLAQTIAGVPGRQFVPWPRPGKPDAWIEFATFYDWKAFLDDFSLQDAVHLPTRLKFHRARKLYLLAWLDLDLVKAGELVALTALELALNDCYGTKVPSRQKAKRPSLKSKPSPKAFADLLRYMVEGDGLTDAQLPIVQKYGGSIMWLLEGSGQPSLAEIRNELAHGHPFDGLPRSGLLELVRDLIHYAYGVR